MNRKRVLTVLAAGLVVAVAAGLYWFQPWQLWVNETVQEALPAVQTSAPPSGSAASASAAPAPKEPAVVATGELISHEHTTSGSVRILRAADGSLVLRLENLDTSNGPDLRVWLTDAPVLPGKDGWFVFDDGAHMSAGKLKGNKGSQNYTLPAGTDLARYSSVTIWCERFSVSFGAASLAKKV
ncbi:DM13 domain-containing protein [Amycolatopsis regifaucium]|uniref:Electron transporter n=1 Tax=Amycolatopsis regifaucium TaxID=546365 RepID=A0A154MIG0_9PSEU|nr:DM13 domain-containing protein [Amycolatopsis regifaucium]KZB83777.1 electron transporter [Amycolatopsis regifaucium]OKA06782.1 electron transporter [Amycolatopsis regifaucium]SFH26644.1 Electron transfer DM13 [Amycolatopsis regifaucium]